MKTTGNVWITPRLLTLLAASCLLATSVGCNSGPDKPDNIPDLTACSVTVMYKGAPVEGASVLLAPKSGSFSAAGTTDSSGVATMKTDGMYDGVAAGEYRVSITKLEKVAVDLGETPEDPAKLAEYEAKLKEQPAPKHLIPEKYASFGSSDLSITIADGTPSEETFELTD